MLHVSRKSKRVLWNACRGRCADERNAHCVLSLRKAHVPPSKTAIIYAQRGKSDAGHKPIRRGRAARLRIAECCLSERLGDRIRTIARLRLAPCIPSRGSPPELVSLIEPDVETAG